MKIGPTISKLVFPFTFDICFHANFDTLWLLVTRKLVEAYRHCPDVAMFGCLRATKIGAYFILVTTTKPDSRFQNCLNFNSILLVSLKIWVSSGEIKCIIHNKEYILLQVTHSD